MKHQMVLKKIAVEVIANTVKFLSKREEEGPSEEIEEPVDEEIPID